MLTIALWVVIVLVALGLLGALVFYGLARGVEGTWHDPARKTFRSDKGETT